MKVKELLDVLEQTTLDSPCYNHYSKELYHNEFRLDGANHDYLFLFKKDHKEYKRFNNLDSVYEDTEILEMEIINIGNISISQGTSKYGVYTNQSSFTIYVK